MMWSDSSSIGHLFLSGDEFEVLYGIFNPNSVEIVDLAPRKDRRNDFVFLRSGQDEDGVCGWLFECLEEGIECLHREHVDLIDDEYAVPSDLRRNADLFGQTADVVHRVV